MNNNRRLTRSANRTLAGVCGGIAEYLDVDPTAVRVAYVLLTLFTCFSGVIVYIILWLLIPEKY
ncbi:MAG: PspC domain-containing protein [Prevotella sp.]|nr:PspC domain-containing protein [Prevotella sp.]